MLGDGSEWIWNQANLHFPDAVHIVDLYHSREHLGGVAAKVYPDDEVARKRWIMVEQAKLDDGKIEDLAVVLRDLKLAHPAWAEEIETEANYFEHNKERMRYAKFREQGLFVGSGVVEAGCKNSGWQAQTIRDVLDRARGQCHHCPPVLPLEWQI